MVDIVCVCLSDDFFPWHPSQCLDIKIIKTNNNFCRSGKNNRKGKNYRMVENCQIKMGSDMSKDGGLGQVREHVLVQLRASSWPRDGRLLKE